MEVKALLIGHRICGRSRAENTWINVVIKSVRWNINRLQLQCEICKGVHVCS